MRQRHLRDYVTISNLTFKSNTLCGKSLSRLKTRWWLLNTSSIHGHTFGRVACKACIGLWEGRSTIHDILWIVIQLLSIYTDMLFLGQLEGGCIGSSQQFKANNGSPNALEHLMEATLLLVCMNVHPCGIHVQRCCVFAPKSLITYYRSSHGF